MARAIDETIEAAARESYGRLLAFVAARTRDLAAAEDALSDAFATALRTWPESGVPDRPEAWLLTAARRKLIDAARRERVRAEALPALLAAADEAAELATGPVQFADERLKLLFVCAHPAIDAADRTPLMLQAVMQLDAARVASAFLVSPAAMARRLTRAKAKIASAGIPFEVPEPHELAPRLDAVLEAVYAAYGSGWEDVSGADRRLRGLPQEALYLGRLIAVQLPREPEALGLLALMLHCEARQEARRDAQGGYVPLAEQETALWSRTSIHEAERALAAAARLGRPGRFQLEAAIQSAHAARAVTGRTDWEAIALLYEGLVRIAPTTGALVGRAAAVGEARGSEAGWAVLQALPSEAVATYQPYWALAAHLLVQRGQADEARAAYDRAIGLCADPAMRAFLRKRAEAAELTFNAPHRR